MNLLARRILKPLLTLTLATAPVTAWGSEGHQIIGEIAQRFLTSTAARTVETLLDPHMQGKLAAAATWADEIKSDPAMRWADHLHYVNPTGDNPPHTCSRFDRARDCPGDACVMGTSFKHRVGCVTCMCIAASRGDMELYATP